MGNPWRPPYPNELYHHGVKGQSWGVRNGPPYPLTQIRHTRNRAAVNSIYRSMSPEEKRFLAGELDNPKVPKQYVSAKEYGPKGTTVRNTIVYYKGKPVAFVDVWNNRGKVGEIAIGTRGGSEYRGKGFATKAMNDTMNWYKKSNLDELQWNAEKANTASVKMSQKYGFKKNGYDGDSRVSATSIYQHHPRHRGR